MTSFVVILLFSFVQIWAANKKDTDFRIIDGQVSTDGQFPYAVALYYEAEDGLHFCGGSLLSDQTVLTAAHCMESARSFSVHVGINYLDEINRSGETINSTSYLIHPDYDPSILRNDIGVVYLERAVTFSNKIQPVELPTQALGANERVVALGWGSTQDEQSLPSNAISHVTLTTISNAVCRRTYGDYIHENMVCLVGVGNQGICDGDSGGPLMQITSEGKNIQVGVASFYSGVGCETEHPSGYTRTFEYIDWIKNVTKTSASSTTASFLSVVMVLYLASACF